MHLSPDLEKHYTRDGMRAAEAQRLAQAIAWGPAIFQASRLMLKFGILEQLRRNPEGLTAGEIAEACGLSLYAATVLLEASLSAGTVIVDKDTDRFSITKAGWFLLTDPSVRVNIDFNHDVNYIGWYDLEAALLEGRPAGLKHFGDWPTVYEGLSSLPEQAQRSWFGFDHFYSDNSFDQALDIVFADRPSTLLDVGGNTGRWALRCVGHDPEVEVTILDLPQQIQLMRKAVSADPGADRIHGHGMNLLDASAPFPAGKWDAVWMSQFLDCFSEDEILSILRRAAAAMDTGSRLYIMETFWDRQRYETATLCLTMTSLYFTAIANGNSRMYHSDTFRRLVSEAGLEVERMHDGLGWGHTVMVCRRR